MHVHLVSVRPLCVLVIGSLVFPFYAATLCFEWMVKNEEKTYMGRVCSRKVKEDTHIDRQTYKRTDKQSYKKTDG